MKDLTLAVPDISPLSLNPLTRDLWGQFDALAIAQLAPLANDPCYQLKFYKAPADDQELMTAGAFASYGMRITPKSVVFGFYLPCLAVPGALTTSAPPQFLVRIRDESLGREWFDDPVASLFLANYKPCYQSVYNNNTGSFPNLLTAPYPVVGTGMFTVEIQESAGITQRIQLVFGVLERCA